MRSKELEGDHSAKSSTNASSLEETSQSTNTGQEISKEDSNGDEEHEFLALANGNRLVEDTTKSSLRPSGKSVKGYHVSRDVNPPPIHSGIVVISEAQSGIDQSDSGGVFIEIRSKRKEKKKETIENGSHAKETSNEGKKTARERSFKRGRKTNQPSESSRADSSLANVKKHEKATTTTTSSSSSSSTTATTASSLASFSRTESAPISEVVISSSVAPWKTSSIAAPTLHLSQIQQEQERGTLSLSGHSPESLLPKQVPHSPSTFAPQVKVAWEAKLHPSTSSSISSSGKLDTAPNLMVNSTSSSSSLLLSSFSSSSALAYSSSASGFPSDTPYSSRGSIRMTGHDESIPSNETSLPLPTASVSFPNRPVFGGGSGNGEVSLGMLSSQPLPPPPPHTQWAVTTPALVDHYFSHPASFAHPLNVFQSQGLSPSPHFMYPSAFPTLLPGYGAAFLPSLPATGQLIPQPATEFALKQHEAYASSVHSMPSSSSKQGPMSLVNPSVREESRVGLSSGENAIDSGRETSAITLQEYRQAQLLKHNKTRQTRGSTSHSPRPKPIQRPAVTGLMTSPSSISANSDLDSSLGTQQSQLVSRLDSNDLPRDNKGGAITSSSSASPAFSGSSKASGPTSFNGPFTSSNSDTRLQEQRSMPTPTSVSSSMESKSNVGNSGNHLTISKENSNRSYRHSNGKRPDQERYVPRGLHGKQQQQQQQQQQQVLENDRKESSDYHHHHRPPPPRHHREHQQQQQEQEQQENPKKDRKQQQQQQQQEQQQQPLRTNLRRVVSSHASSRMIYVQKQTQPKDIVSLVSS